MNDTEISLAQTKEQQKGQMQRISLSAGLYLVATPIGNLGDITLRAVEILQQVDVILCEDQRVTRKLLSHLGIKKNMMVCHDHNEEAMAEQALKMIEQGQAVALVSDAGTPLISDPGYRLVRAVYSQGYHVTALPGANAILPAVQLSALPSHNFYFGGFLPSKKSQCRKSLAQAKEIPSLLVFYESPHRVIETIKIVAEIFDTQQIAVVREISKKFEQAETGSPQEILELIDRGAIPIKGEFVLLIDNHLASGEKNYSVDMPEITERIKRDMDQCSAKDLSMLIAEETGLRKKDVYAQIQKLKKKE